MQEKLKNIEKVKKISEIKLTHNREPSREIKNQWLSKADKLFELLSEKEQSKFLEKIKDKCGDYL